MDLENLISISSCVGASIYACQRSGCHIIAIEEDVAIFKDILQSLIVDPIAEGLKKQRISDPQCGAGSNNEENSLIVSLCHKAVLYVSCHLS